jgi:bifunctional non-homologous end joining protein LigD
MVIRINRLPAGFVIPAQPILASKPPSGADWVHEIKHDGYRMIVCRDGPTVRLYSRNAYDWTVRLSAIASAAERIKAKTFTIDGEAVVLGPDGLSRFEELSRREAAQTAILYTFDLIEHNGKDLRKLPFLDRKAALARLLRDTEAGILLNEHVAEDGPTAFSPCVPAWCRGRLKCKTAPLSLASAITPPPTTTAAPALAGTLT